MGGTLRVRRLAGDRSPLLEAGRPRATVVVALSALTLLLALVPARSADAASRRKVSVVYGVLAQQRMYADAVTVGVPSGARAVLQVRLDGRTRIVARRRVRAGRASLRWRYPRRATSLRVRVIVRGRRNRSLATGKWKSIALDALKSAKPLAKIRPENIQSVPPPGEAGALTLSGEADVKPGEIVALGVTDKTPDGLLAEIRSVESGGGSTVAQTIPATLPDVMPVGAMDVELSQADLPSGTISGAHQASGLGQQISKNFSCDNSQKMQAGGSLSLSTGLKLETSWHLGFSGLSMSARFEGNVTAAAKLLASVNGQASCDLAATPLFPVPISLGTYAFTVGPVPVVLRPQAQLYLSAHGQVDASLSTSIEASVTARAGVAYDGNRFSPFGGVTPKLTYTPPTLAASGTAEATLAPTIDVLLYGVAGPRIDFRAGLKLKAQLSASPWWTLTAPMSLGAQLRLDVWAFSLSSPRLEVWSSEPQLAAASTPAPPPLVPGGTPNPTGVPGGRAHISWDSSSDIDLHTWDAQGNHSYFSQKDAIPDAHLIEDIIPGFGPEDFVETGSTGRTLTFGLCDFSGDGGTVNVAITDPDGSVRTFTRTLPGYKSAALITMSPDNGSGYIPAPGWCDSNGGDPTSFG